MKRFSVSCGINNKRAKLHVITISEEKEKIGAENILSEIRTEYS
jgi:hypothetical protein